MEDVIFQLAATIETKDFVHVQQLLLLLSANASHCGDHKQRLVYWFLRALLSRASMIVPDFTNMVQMQPLLVGSRLLTVTELAGYVDLIPWHRFGFSAANGAIRRAIQDKPRLHILDFSTTYCMQWPTLIDRLAKRPGGAPSIRITVPIGRPHVPPFLNMSMENIGIRLTNFAKSKDVKLEFCVVNASSKHWSVDPSMLDLRPNEVLAVNFQNWLRYVPNTASSKDNFLCNIRNLDPSIVTIVDEDYDLDSPSLSLRIRACLEYLWIPYDALATFLPKESNQRLEYEADIGRKIENVIVFEDDRRIERAECGDGLARRMDRIGFAEEGFHEETLSEVRALLEEDANGWGMKREENGLLVLTWKGHKSVFASTWIIK